MSQCFGACETFLFFGASVEPDVGGFFHHSIIDGEELEERFRCIPL